MSRVIDVADFVGALERIAKGASVVDPALVQELVSAVGATTLWRGFAREQEVVMLMAEGPVETQDRLAAVGRRGRRRRGLPQQPAKLKPARNR
jgi:hypothetical protein